MSKPSFISAECPECGAFFDRLPVDYDEDGTAYAALEVAPCTHAGCGRFLCVDCLRYNCYACDRVVCASHSVEVMESGKPEHYCIECAIEAGEYPAPKPPQPELVYAAGVQMEVA